MADPWKWDPGGREAGMEWERVGEGGLWIETSGRLDNCFQKEVKTANHILKNLRGTKAEQVFLSSNTLSNTKCVLVWEQNMCKTVRATQKTQKKQVYQIQIKNYNRFLIRNYAS